MNNTTVYVITYWGDSSEPVVTVFDNKDGADQYLAYCKANFANVCMDLVPVYHTFTIS